MSDAPKSVRGSFAYHPIFVPASPRAVQRSLSAFWVERPSGKCGPFWEPCNECTDKCAQPCRVWKPIGSIRCKLETPYSSHSQSRFWTVESDAPSRTRSIDSQCWQEHVIAERIGPNTRTHSWEPCLCVGFGCVAVDVFEKLLVVHHALLV